MIDEKEENNVLLLGIDDAGRGPVLGPMILAGCILNKENEKQLKKLGVDDSKLLTRKKREKLVKVIKEKAIAYESLSVSPSEIDTGMGIGLNLNEVEALESALIIKELIKKIKVDEIIKLKIIIDCPSVNTEAWKRTLLGYLEKEKIDTKFLSIDCRHKADLDYPVVSAASIIAKTTRDNEVEKLKKQIGKDFGSGYPADPKTIGFLKKYINDPEIKKARIFRESWATYQNIKMNKGQSKLPDY